MFSAANKVLNSETYPTRNQETRIYILYMIHSKKFYRVVDQNMLLKALYTKRDCKLKGTTLNGLNYQHGTVKSL